MKIGMHLIYWLAIGLLLTLFIGECRKKSPEPCPTIVGTTETKTQINGAVAPYTPTPDTAWSEKQYQDLVARGTSKRTTPQVTRVTQNGTASDYFTPDEQPGRQSPGRQRPILNKTDPITYYNDSTDLIQGKDTVGKVWVKDKIQNNMIAERFWTFQAFKTTTTNNVEVRKNRWFAGIKALGNQQQPVQWFGGSLGLLNKKQKKFFTISAGPMNSKIFYEAGVYFKIGK